ncbi:hypothetical protein [Kordiimonas lipolytica]|nr:hypothetical protein [Kordiimonas lipolytica]
MIVPSFSSRGFPDIKKIIDGAREYVNDQALISAYDLHYKHILKTNWNFSELLFVDSGGYEFGKEIDLSDANMEDNHQGSRTWTPEQHLETLRHWKFPKATVLVSYDNPNRRLNIGAQINRARRLFEEFPNAGSDILIKAERRASRGDQRAGFVWPDQIAPYVGDLAEFDIIGFTEKELGRSINERVEKVYQFRALFDNAGLDKPIHIFGSLDPISSHLYFLAGADIFDGLTWLRYAYHNHLAIYRHNFAALEIDRNTIESSINSHVHQRNCNYLMTMQSQMRRFLNAEDFGVFDGYDGLFRNCMDDLMARVGGV